MLSLKSQSLLKSVAFEVSFQQFFLTSQLSRRLVINAKVDPQKTPSFPSARGWRIFLGTPSHWSQFRFVSRSEQLHISTSIFVSAIYPITTSSPFLFNTQDCIFCFFTCLNFTFNRSWIQHFKQFSLLSSYKWDI